MHVSQADQTDDQPKLQLHNCSQLFNTLKLLIFRHALQHLLTTDAISWSVLANIRLTEDDTTSSSRIFIKILFQDLSENMGLLSLNMRLQEPTLQMYFDGIFPKVCHYFPCKTHYTKQLSLLQCDRALCDRAMCDRPAVAL